MDRTKEDKNYSKMTERPIPLLILGLGLPTTLSMMTTTIYNMADTYFVGQLGKSASGAIGVIAALMSIIQAFGFMYGHGAGSLLSRRLGSHDTENASRFASTSLFLALVTGLTITSLGLAFMNPLLYLLGSSDTILPYAREYAKYILLAAPITMSGFVLNNILRYEGKASLAMIGLISGGLLNIAGDWLLTRRLGMGVAGAGIATALSQCVSFLLLLSIFLLGHTQSKLKLRYISFDKIFTIMATGLPSLIRQGLASISNMVLNHMAGYYGQDAAIAAITIVNKMSFFIFAVALGIGQGFQPVSSFNWGAKKYSRVKEAFRFTYLAGSIFLAVLAFVGLLVSPFVVSFFTDEQEVIRIGTLGLQIALIGLVFQPVSVCSNMLFQSLGINGRASFLSALRSGIAFIPMLFLLGYFFGLTGVLCAQPAADLISFAISAPISHFFLKKLPPDGTVM